MVFERWSEGYLSRTSKLDWLARGAEAGELPHAVPVVRSAMDGFRPRPFADGAWPSLRECFDFHKFGMKSGNDTTFVAADPAVLLQRVDEFVERSGPRVLDKARQMRLSYRPFDLRWFYNDPGLLNRPGPELQRVWGEANVALYALPGGTGAGPALWCHGLLPDYHGFRGSYGGYAFPLHDRRPEVAQTNVAQALVDGLSAAYGLAVAPEAVFDAILSLLSAPRYTLRFAEDLEDVFAHLPFPADPAVFLRAATLGAQIRAVQTFDPAHVSAARLDTAFVRLGTAPTAGAVLQPGASQADGLVLCAELALLDENEATRNWEYAVLVCDTPYKLEHMGQLYRDRADCENGFDEIKNQWGRGGYSTQDIERCALSARAAALIYNWWSWYVRLANPKRRMEAITSRPKLAERGGQADPSCRPEQDLADRHA